METQRGPEVAVPTKFFEADPSLQEHIRSIAEQIGEEVRTHLPKN